MSDRQTTARDFRDPSRQPTDPTPARWWARLLDGPHDWGSVEASPPRYGVTRYRLVLFPPGINTEERRFLRIWRVWPTWGAMLWLAAQIFLSALHGPGTALVAATIAYLGAGLLVFGRVAELRGRVRTLTIVRMAGYPDPHATALFAELKELVTALCHADAQRDRGRCSPADYEAVWWRVYDRLGQLPMGPSDAQPGS